MPEHRDETDEEQRDADGEHEQERPQTPERGRNLRQDLLRSMREDDAQPLNNPRSLLQALRGFDLSYLEELRESQAEPLSALLAACERTAYGISDELTQRFFVHAGERPQTSVAA